MVSNVCEIRFLYCSNYFLDKGLFYPYYFTEKTHCFVMSDAHTAIIVKYGAIRNYEWTQVIQIDQCCIIHKHILSISEN